MEYLQNLSDSEIKMLVSIFLSIFTILLIIRNRIVDNYKKLEIKATFPLSFKSHDTSLHNGTRIFSINILNKGNIPIFIENPLIKYPHKLNGKNYFYLLAKNGSDKFPIKLDVGEIYRKEDILEPLILTLKKEFKSSDKIQIIIKDTLDNKYFSKKIKIKTLEMALLDVNSVETLS